jgi:hypothetical protein
VKTTSRPSGLPAPCRLIPQLTASATPPAPANCAFAEAAAAIGRHRATAVRTLREHRRAGETCTRCHNLWPCAPAHLAATALGAG